MLGSEIPHVTKLTDAISKEKLQDISGSSSSVSVEGSFGDGKRNVKSDTNEMDARLRIIILSVSYLELY